MGWLPQSITVISQFALRHGILTAAVAGLTAALIATLPRLFENLPTIIESIYKRRRGILEAKKDINAAKAEGRVNRIRAITDRRASRTRSKEQSMLLRKVKVESPSDAIKLIQAIHMDPDQPEKRRLPDAIFGEIYGEGGGNSATAPPPSRPPGNVQRLRKPGPS